jgi:nucleoside phosphorylase
MQSQMRLYISVAGELSPCIRVKEPTASLDKQYAALVFSFPAITPLCRVTRSRRSSLAPRSFMFTNTNRFHNTMKIALFSALPQEYGRFKRGVGPWGRLTGKPFQCFSGSVSDKELTLIETGMGKAGQSEAFRWIVGISRPDLIVSMGFAGSLCADFDVGHVILGNRFLHLPSSPASARHAVLRMEIHPRLDAYCRSGGIEVAQVVTADRPESKAETSRRFAATPCVMDMESYFLCGYSVGEGIPFLSLRAVSDGVADEIDFDVDAISNSAGKIRIAKVISAAIAKPSLIRTFLESWQRSRRAAEQLARALTYLLSVPENDLRDMVPVSSFRQEESEER